MTTKRAGEPFAATRSAAAFRGASMAAVNAFKLTGMALFLGLCLPQTMAQIKYAGVNLAGAEFGQGNLPGTYNTHYTYPNQAEVDYFAGRGMNLVRLPFRWECLQQATNASLNAAELSRLHNFVSATTAKGVYIILEPHNFARYYPDPANFQSSAQGLIGSYYPNSVFSNFWWRLAGVYRTNQHVIFNLMNEPNSMPTEQWVAAANAAIAGIRAAGATNLIHVPGNQWTGAHAWTANYYGTPNSVAMLNLVDPASNHLFEVHQYLDSDSSGTSTNIVNASIGVTRLSAFTSWLRTHNKRGFLGEFAVANSTIGSGTTQIGDEALTNMLSYIAANSDVWEGWAWWAAGPWWGNYMFTLEPTNLGQPGQTERAAMPILRSFIPIPAPVLELANQRIKFPSRLGFIYQPQAAPSLSGTWTNHGPALAGNGQPLTINMTPGTGGASFYRVSVSRAP
jgi:endoglucanase